MIGVTFSPTELRILRGIGKLRNEETSKHGTEMKQDPRKDPVQIAIDGVMTEYAVAKFLNLHFDLNCNYRKFGADLISHTGLLIDVKSTETLFLPTKIVPLPTNAKNAFVTVPPRYCLLLVVLGFNQAS